jgi:4-hydroxybenzoyl-CoA thioesterase
MARVVLQAPAVVHFQTNISIRISDINYGGHLGNDALLSLMQEARMLFFKHYGYTEMNLAGVGIIMSDAAVVYKSEGFHGNELLIKISVYDFTPKSFDLFYQIENITTEKTLAWAKTGIVCFDYTERKTAYVPVEFKSLFEQ